MKSRSAHPEIKALSNVLTFGKYKGWKVEDIIQVDANYILWLSDEKIAQVSKSVIEYAEEAEIEQRWSEAMDGELSGMRFWDIMGDD